MSIRTWQVPPSAQIDLETGRHTVVTQEDLIKAVVDGAIMVDRAGGCLSLAVMRLPTGIPNEYVTTAALVTWQDRTNAKPQPEPSALEGQNAAIEAVIDRAGEHIIGLDDGLRVDPDVVDESDPELQAALGG